MIKESYNNKIFLTFANKEVLEVLVKSITKGKSYYTGPSWIILIRSRNLFVITTLTYKAKSTYYLYLNIPESKKRKQVY